jgi:hypothetical protein
MGPNTLFDKSFLQCLTVDEAVWFDHFFTPVVSPLFYAEVLADLEKNDSRGRTPEAVVASIAQKFPEKNGIANPHHVEIALQNLLGQEVPMDGQALLSGPRRVVKDGDHGQGVLYDESKEAGAFRRWKQGRFRDVERLYAKDWRESLQSADLRAVAALVADPLLEQRPCKTLQDAADFARDLVAGLLSPSDALFSVLDFLGPSQELRRVVLDRHQKCGFPPLVDFAPYAAFVLRVELFFHIAVRKTLISPDRASNRIDVAYLFYLPFCSLFFSWDKLHERTATFFLRDDQRFMIAPHLKADLAQVNDHYMKLPDSTKRKGLFDFAPTPPFEQDFIVCRIWDEFFPGWREDAARPRAPRDPGEDEQTLREMKALFENAEGPLGQTTSTPSVFGTQTVVQIKRGSWFQVPSDVTPSSDDDLRKAAGLDDTED